jgi:REP element-mobilizing transposase RayT
MSRAWRIEYEGALYHLMSRGNLKADIFCNDNDRQTMLDALGEFSDRFEIDVFAYVLMNNHYHLLVRTNLPNLKRAMHWLGTTYTQRFNFRHDRSGHLFQGRYKSIIVENDAYLLRLSYYIHRNPLRARMVKRLADYRWSSYLFYAYNRKTPEWLSTDLILSQHQAFEDPCKSYRMGVQQYAKEGKDFWEDFRYGLAFGSKKFVERLRRKYLPAETRADVPQQVHLSKQADDVKSFIAKTGKLIDFDNEKLCKNMRLTGLDKNKRDLLIYFLWRSGKLTNQEIGNLLSISYSAVSHSVKSIKSKLDTDSELNDYFYQINSQFKL